ncbi:MAG TPA: PHP domain-containing protein [Syntrophorhabdaceae bacterium]|nr:PHP domain-containing protein [Syntrophorhabdaceae bacterium]HNT68046.1 PHP domain-containing protein [Syntrophorhabdaceae bacterium]
MKSFSCDLHIHSTLSPCGDLEMSPRNIVKKASEVGLGIIAITDHNMTENSFYAHELGEKSGILVLFGMELQTEEEVHVLAIFDSFETAFLLQKTVYDLLPPVKNDPDFFGDQVVVDGNDQIVRFEDRLLLNSAQISIAAAVSWIKSHGGLAIPCHIDSPTFSIISQLGYVPDGVPFDALEIRDIKNAHALAPLILQKHAPFVTFSDAHYLQDIGRRATRLDLDEPSCKEIERALKILGDNDGSLPGAHQQRRKETL